MDVENLLAKTSDSISVRRAFGTAYEKDGTLIIPVAMVTGGGGAGTASPRHRNPAARPGSPPGENAMADETVPQDSGHKDKDAGGGFGGLVLPSGVYVVKGDE